MAAAFLYPVALDLRGRKCVIAGGGAVAGRRAAGLLDAGAEVVVVAPEIRDSSLQGWIDSGRANFIPGAFFAACLDGAFVAVAATDDRAANAGVAAAARERGVLLNLAAPAGNDPASDSYDSGNTGEAGGDFVTMAPVRRGDLLVAVTTGGAGPAITSRVRRDLETLFGPEWVPYVTLMREMRETAQDRFRDTNERTRALRRLAAQPSILERLAAGDEDGARQEALACLS